MSIAPMSMAYSIERNEPISNWMVNKKEMLVPKFANETSDTARICMVQDSYNRELALKQAYQMSELSKSHTDAFKALGAKLVSPQFDISLNFEKSSTFPLLTGDVFICDWLTRIKSQFDP